jgi:hypothetical protein
LGNLLVDVFATAIRALDFAFFVFRQSQDDFKRLLAIFAVKFVARHGHLRNAPEGWNCGASAPKHYARETGLSSGRGAVGVSLTLDTYKSE